MEGSAVPASSAAAALGAGGDVPPAQTLYIQNLTEKVKKAPLKKSLFVAFSPFGRVVDIVHCRSNALRGQAWVVFGDVASATAAMAKMQSFPLFDKPMVRGGVGCIFFLPLHSPSRPTHTHTH
jgi:U1 small nuclear ribonucleoprotein A